ncbi:MAG: hypothetical protein IJT42_09590 [Treponema sp.]|nr:hypothetical protein [Treponema sp.]
MKENNRFARSICLAFSVILCVGILFAESDIAQKEDFPPAPKGEMMGKAGLPPMGGHDMSKQFDAVIKVDSGTKTLKNETITSDEDNKNALFAQNDGKIIASGLTIRTKQNGSRGLYVAFGGTIEAKKVDVETLGEHCAAFATDMGEGSVTVDGGKALTKGKGSPVIYSTGDISVKNLSGNAENSEMAVIEGKNSVTIEKSNLTGGSGLDGEVSAGVMLYQSMSGDANEGTAFFTAKNSSLTNRASGEKSAFFYVTNTNAVVNLEKTELLGNTETLIIASGNDSRRGWGRKGANGGQLEFNLISQQAKGDIIVDKISSVKLNLGKKSSLTGAINADKGGKVDIFIEKSAKLEVTADSYFNKFADADDSYKNIKSNGHTIFYNKKLEENSYLKGRTIILPDGGKLAPAEYDFTLTEKTAFSSEKGLPGKENGRLPMENGKPGEKGGKEPPKMEMTVLTGKLNIVSSKAMLIDDDNKATVLKVMEAKAMGGDKEGPKGGRAAGGQPPMGEGGFSGGMQPPSDMGGNPPDMKTSGRSDMKRPKPVTFDDLKKLKGKKVEIQGVMEKDGSFMVFTISEKK